MKKLYDKSLLACLCLHEGLVELLGKINLVIESGHLLLIVQQLLTSDLLHVTMLVVKPLDFSLRLLQRQRLIEQIGL